MPVTTIGSTMWRVTPQGVTRRDAAASARGPWLPATTRALRALPADSDEATWLRAQGVDRWRSGSSVAEAERTTDRIVLRLSPPVAAELRRRAAAGGLTVAAVVSALVMAKAGDT